MRFLSVVAVGIALFTIVLGYPSRDFTKRPEDQEQQATNSQAQKNNNEDDSDMYMEAMEHEDTLDHSSTNEQVQTTQSQTFYPSFSPFQDPPLGHSRPFFFQQEGAYSHRPNGFQQQQFNFDSAARFSGYKSEVNPKASIESQDLLGSGNFGVIRGGTFYNDNDGDHLGYEARFNPYYYNGHGRPSYYRGNPRPQQHEQFANFRDFADINTPSSPAYSQYVVVYANKNGTKSQENQKHVPRNILEHLAMLDEESSTSEKPLELIPTKKMSKSKKKLALLPPEKKPYSAKSKKSSSVKDVYEPLLALS